MLQEQVRQVKLVQLVQGLLSGKGVGFPSQMKKGVDKHRLSLDLRRRLSRDSRGLRS